MLDQCGGVFGAVCLGAMLLVLLFAALEWRDINKGGKR